MPRIITEVSLLGGLVGIFGSIIYEGVTLRRVPSTSSSDHHIRTINLFLLRVCRSSRHWAYGRCRIRRSRNIFPDMICGHDSKCSE